MTDLLTGYTLVQGSTPSVWQGRLCSTRDPQVRRLDFDSSSHWQQRMHPACSLLSDCVRAEFGCPISDILDRCVFARVGRGTLVRNENVYNLHNDIMKGYKWYVLENE